MPLSLDVCHLCLLLQLCNTLSLKPQEYLATKTEILKVNSTSFLSCCYGDDSPVPCFSERCTQAWRVPGEIPSPKAPHF